MMARASPSTRDLFAGAARTVCRRYGKSELRWNHAGYQGTRRMAPTPFEKSGHAHLLM